MHLDLGPEEARTLLRAIDAYLPELDFDLARVKLERDRHELVVYEETLRRIRDRLAALTRSAA